MKRQVHRLSKPPVIDADWDKAPWDSITPLSVENAFGVEPEHRPRTQARVGYDHEAVYVIFRVEDRYVRAVAAKRQDPVYKDSCVEFFFVPGRDLSRGYFNLEMNAGGFMLFHFQAAPKQNVATVSEPDCAQVRIAHSLPQRVEPEIVAPVVWTVECRIPVGILPRYTRVNRPAPGAVWRVNFYKCGDETSHPHWLTWSPVPKSPLGFHFPQAFGELEFM
ncbi:MAG: carbohydrate-binding family 9-like protein [Verrucomicrobiota bacterium]|nr:carbohydrate-binding family 9-like protein [Verrucomicrobiota bacterium]